jgi:hypothetical protein
MNGRRIFREYARSKGKVATEFVSLDKKENQEILITKDKDGNVEETVMDYRNMVFWIFRNNKKLFKTKP